MPCSRCFANTLCAHAAGASQESKNADALTTGTKTVERGTALYRCHDPLSAIFVVQHGTLKTFVVSREGQYKVTGFHLPGNTMGLEAISGGQHISDAVALEDSEVCAIPYDQLELISRRVPELYLSLLRALSSRAWRDQALLLSLGSMTAEERVAAFVVTLANRFAADEAFLDELHLPMTRHDIASYLGLAHETVSRVLSELSRDGYVDVYGRTIRLTDRKQVEQRCGAWATDTLGRMSARSDVFNIRQYEQYSHAKSMTRPATDACSTR